MARLSDAFALLPLPSSAARFSHSARPPRSPQPGVTALALLLLIVATGCGGSQPGATDAGSREGDAQERAGSGQATQDGGQQPAQHCTDGSCFTCGDGLCPPGFYCDEGAGGGPACSWAPACPAEPDCACLGRELGSGCRCEQRGSGLYVTCE